MGITATQFKKALQTVPGAFGGQKWSMQELADGANQAAAEMGITTRQGLAILVAQCMIESAWYRTTTEYGAANSLRYDPYRGRTFIQITWAANYRMVGRYCKKKGLLTDSEYFVKNPARLSDYKWAWRGPAAYFEANGLVARANRGENKAVGRIIHAGPGRVSYPINAQERQRENQTVRAYNALMSAGITAPTGGGASTRKFSKDEVKRLQRQVGVADDGLWGNGTERNAQAIRAFLKGGVTPTDAQRDIYMKVREARPAGKRTTAAFRKGIQWALGVTVDGIWGKNTEAAFQGMRDQHKMAGVKDPAPKPAAKPKPSTPKAPKFPLPKGHYFGPKSGPASSVSGFYSHRADLRKWQQRMSDRGWTITADGYYGNQTRDVARAFQREKGLAVDGKIGPATWRAAWEARVT